MACSKYYSKVCGQLAAAAAGGGCRAKPNALAAAISDAGVPRAGAVANAALGSLSQVAAVQQRGRRRERVPLRTSSHRRRTRAAKPAPSSATRPSVGVD